MTLRSSACFRVCSCLPYCCYHDLHALDSVLAEHEPLSIPDLKLVPILAVPFPKLKVVLLPELTVAPFPEVEPLPLPVVKVALLRGLEEPLSVSDLELVPIFRCGPS